MQSFCAEQRPGAMELTEVTESNKGIHLRGAEDMFQMFIVFNGHICYGNLQVTTGLGHG